MNGLFAVQVISSFIIGGGFIALLSFIAERANSHFAGIVLAFPSTAALGFFFLGWTLSSDDVARIIPSTLIPLGLCLLFPVLYIFFAELLVNFCIRKVSQIAITFIVSTITWLVLASPLAISKFSSFTLGILGYLALAILANFLLHRKNYEKPPTLTYTLNQKIGRAVFIGLIIVLVVVLGRTLNPFWGGVFAMFPAAFSSSLMVLHWYYDPKSLLPTFQTIAIGSISIFMYSITVKFVFPWLGFVFGTFTAYSVSLITAAIISRVQLRQFTFGGQSDNF